MTGLYGWPIDGMQDLIVVREGRPIPEGGYVHDCMIHKSIVSGTVVVNSPFGTFRYANRDTKAIVFALRELAQRIEDNGNGH